MTGRTDAGRVPNFRAWTAASRVSTDGTNEEVGNTSSAITAGSGGMAEELRMVLFSA
jgi:hypothetical protein